MLTYKSFTGLTWGLRFVIDSRLFVYVLVQNLFNNNVLFSFEKSRKIIILDLTAEQSYVLESTIKFDNRLSSLSKS